MANIYLYALGLFVILALIIYGLVLMIKMDDRRTEQKKRKQQTIGVLIVAIGTLAIISVSLRVLWKYGTSGDCDI